MTIYHCKDGTVEHSSDGNSWTVLVNVEEWTIEVTNKVSEFDTMGTEWTQSRRGHSKATASVNYVQESSAASQDTLETIRLSDTNYYWRFRGNVNTSERQLYGQWVVAGNGQRAGADVGKCTLSLTSDGTITEDDQP